MKYRVGDVVRVRSNLKYGRKYGNRYFTKDMIPYMGKEFKIRKILFPDDPDISHYWLDGLDNFQRFTDEMLEPAENFNSVTRPEHYVSGGIECIDAMVAAFGKDATADFCICNAFKYIWRHRKKGNPKQDCEKAIWYLNKYIELKAGKVNDDT